MPFWVYLLIYAATFLVTELLRPKPQIEDAKPAGLGDFQVPTATEGRVIPVIWGRVKISGPNVTWYGDLVATPLKEKVKTGLFSKKTVITGYTYALGLQFGLCRGPVDLLRHIRCDESFCWGPDASTADAPIAPTDSGAAFFINQPAFFGGEDAGGGGGLVGPGRIWIGSETQTVSGYLATFQSPLPAYRGNCYVVFERMGVGFAPTLRPFEFELERFPDGLDLGTLQPGDERIGDSVNPMNVLFELLTDDDWGFNLSPTGIDVAALRSVAATLATEGNGFAWIWDRPLDRLEIINLIEQQVDGVFFQDPISGAYSFKLIRFDYTPGTLELLDPSNVRSITRFSRPSWAETQNQIQAEFNDPRKNYTQSFAVAQDMANIDIVGAIKASKVRFPGCKDAALANSLAWRELRQLSFPVATGQLVANRSQYAITPGDVRELTWPRLNLVRLPIRITKVNRGRMLDNIIKIDWAQDIFSASAGSFADPPDTDWAAPVDVAVAPVLQAIFELPYRITDLGDGTNTEDLQLGTLFVRGNNLTIGYNAFTTFADPPTAAPAITESDIIDPGGSSGMTPYGLLTAALDAGEANGFQDAVGFTIDNGIDLDQLENATATERAAGKNVLLIDQELMTFDTVVDNLNGTYTISNLRRGALDTVPAAHANNAPVLFISYGLGLVNTFPFTDTTLNLRTKLQPFTPFDVFDFASISELSLTPTIDRAGKGNPPRNIQINPSAPGGGYFPTDAGSPSGAELVGDLSVTLFSGNKFTAPFDLPWDEATGYPPEAGTTYRLRIIEDPGGANTVVRDTTGITIGGTGQTTVTESAFADDAVTDLYQVELSSQNAVGDSQVWPIGPFRIYGWGYKYGEKYGGDSAGSIV